MQRYFAHATHAHHTCQVPLHAAQYSSQFCYLCLQSGDGHVDVLLVRISGPQGQYCAPSTPCGCTVLNTAVLCACYPHALHMPGTAACGTIQLHGGLSAYPRSLHSPSLQGARPRANTLLRSTQGGLYNSYLTLSRALRGFEVNKAHYCREQQAWLAVPANPCWCLPPAAKTLCRRPTPTLPATSMTWSSGCRSSRSIMLITSRRSSR